MILTVWNPPTKSLARNHKPQGQPTRGKTALNRLRQVDTYVALAWSQILTRPASPLVVDVGYGAHAWTALEMWERWHPLNPHVRLLGLEIDPERVNAALPYQQQDIIKFRLGGFNVQAALAGQSAHLIRAYNVLRQYDESAVGEALELMGQGLAVGGLLIEGTSTPSGGLVVFDVYQRTPKGLEHRELVFGTNFHEPPNPTHFQAILPKRLIHHALDDQPAAFFTAWRRSVDYARGQGFIAPPRQWSQSLKLLQTQFGYPINTRPRILGRGFLALRDSLLPIVL